MFDGSGAKVDTTRDADIRVFATQPASSRADIETFTTPSSQVRTYGTGTATLCASLTGRTLPAVLPYCATTLASAQVPHWTPATNGANVPASPMTRMAWTTGTGEVRVSVPKAKRDASAFTNLTVKVAADESVVVGGGTDLTLTVVDGTGATYSTLVSALNPNALVRLPQSTQNPTTLGKVVLQQVTLPLADMVGVNTADLREVRFTAAVGIDGLTTGAAYLSDLAFDSPAVGTAEVTREVSVGTAPVAVEEGTGPDEAQVPVVLSGPATVPVTAYVTVAGSTAATAKVGLAMQKVVFAPGEVCKPITVATYGDVLASTAGSTAFKISVTNTSNAHMGADAYANLVVREDDGVDAPGTALPAVGVQGDACDEHAALSTIGSLTVSDTTPAPGETVTVTGTGFRSGESVAFSLAGTAWGSAVADGSGMVAYAGVLPVDVTLGTAAITAVGAGSGASAAGELTVLTRTSTTLTVSPTTPSIGQAVTLTATVTGAADGVGVTFQDGTKVLGAAPLTAGVATLSVKAGFAAGDHALVATTAATATSSTSTSDVVALTLLKPRSTIALSLSTTSSTYGSAVRATVVVGGKPSGTVRITYGTVATTVTLKKGTASLTLPATLAPGTYTVGATFTGTATAEPSDTATATLTVAKKATTTSVSVKGTVKKSADYTTTVTVEGAVAGTYPTGSAAVYVMTGSGEYKLTKTVTLEAKAKGKVAISLKAPATTGTIRVKVVYSGSSTYGGSTSAAKAVTITK